MYENKYIPATSEDVEERILAIHKCWEEFFSEIVALYKRETASFRNISKEAMGVIVELIANIVIFE